MSSAVETAEGFPPRGSCLRSRLMRGQVQDSFSFVATSSGPSGHLPALLSATQTFPHTVGNHPSRGRLWCGADCRRLPPRGKPLIVSSIPKKNNPAFSQMREGGVSLFSLKRHQHDDAQRRAHGAEQSVEPAHPHRFKVAARFVPVKALGLHGHGQRLRPADGLDQQRL